MKIFKTVRGMYHTYSAQTIIDASKDVIFSEYTKVNRWNAWDNELEYSRIDGVFENGVTGSLQPVNGNMLSFTLDNITVGVSYDLVTRLPLGGSFVISHLIEPISDSSCKVTHTGYSTGLAGLFIGLVLKMQYKDKIGQVLDNFKNIVESQKIA